jgi:hypothetical protein
MYANYNRSGDVLLAASCTVVALTSLCAGFVAAWAAGEAGEVRHGLLSSLLCIVAGLLSLVVLHFSPFFLPLCVVSPIFGGLGGCCRKLLRTCRRHRPLDAGLQMTKRL